MCVHWITNSLQTHRPVTPIFVTDAPSVLFSALDGSETLPVSIAFAPPTADTVRTLLYAACPPGEEPYFFRQFVDHVRSRTNTAHRTTSRRSIPSVYASVMGVHACEV